jgi:hypothetical protein
MSVYDCIPVEHHGMSEWTLFVFVIAGITTAISIKLFESWRTNHDAHMHEQVKRIDAHDQQLNNVAVDIAEIKVNGKHTKESLERIEEPLNDMRDITKMAIAKVMEKDK